MKRRNGPEQGERSRAGNAKEKRQKIEDRK
jgi:hypothetical protein